MKKLKKILSTIILLCVIFSTLTAVNAATSNNISVEDISKTGNKVTFKLKYGVALLGDVNLDGVVKDDDLTYLSKHVADPTAYPLSSLGELAADVNVDGEIGNNPDLVQLSKIVGEAIEKISVQLEGDLASKCTYEIRTEQTGEKVNEKSYFIDVTLPANTTEGTIGIKLIEGKWGVSKGIANTELISKFDIAKNAEIKPEEQSKELNVLNVEQKKQDDGKVKVTITVDKELDSDNLPKGWTLSDDKKSVSKVMEDGTKESVKLVATDGSTITKEIEAKAEEKKEEFKIVEVKPEKQSDGKIKVTVTVNKEIDSKSLPKGWTLSDDKKSISKIMEEGKTEEIKIVATDGSIIEETITAKVEEEKKEESGDKTTANKDIPQTGVTNILVLIIGTVAIVGIIAFIRSRKLLK